MNNFSDLNGKTAFVTGASGGLGKQFVYTLAAAGARVILAARSLDKLEVLAAELGNAIPIQMDLSDKESIISGFQKVNRLGEKIDICVNNAGTAKLKTPIFSQDDNENFEQTIALNLTGVWNTTKAAVNHMRDNSIHGSIIKIASIHGADKLRENITAQHLKLLSSSLQEH